MAENSAIEWTDAQKVGAADSLNRIAFVANLLDDTLTPRSVEIARDDLWSAVNALREAVFGPHDGVYPIREFPEALEVGHG